MAKRSIQQRSTTSHQKRKGASLSDEESPTKRLAGNTAMIDLSDTPDVPEPAFQGHSRGSSSESRRPVTFRPAQVHEDDEDDEDVTHPVTTIENDTIKVETSNRAGTIVPGLTVLGQHVTKLVDLITKLRDNGIERLDVDLPQIVVVGDQSTGKSSLIEGLSAIKVPRAEGACTRCPIEINLKATTDPWHCRISIVKKYKYNAPADEINPSLGLGPYNAEMLPASVEIFAEVTNKDEIPIWLGRAQCAVLNPSTPIKAFAVPLRQNVNISMQEPFSPNVVRLEIYAPNLPSLNFFDLPGVVVQAEDAYPHVPKMIRKLVESYITPSKSLVLLTLPIDSDRANSSAAGLVQEANASDRTIGIISKPDNLVKANVQQWREILSGEKYKYKLGYRVVKNPRDPRIDHAQARREEREFFSTNEHFSVTLGMFQDRFGTDRLSEFLSRHLVTMIRDCLPEIEAKVSNRVSMIKDELLTLPKPPTNPVVYEIQNKLADFAKQLQDITGNSMDSSAVNSPFYYKEGADWFRSWHKNAQMYFEKLIRSAPQLDTPEPKRIDLTSDEASDQQAQGMTDSEKQALIPISSHASFTGRQKKEIRASAYKHTKRFTIAQLKDQLHAYNGGVYGIGDPRMFESMLKESISHWSVVSSRFLEKSAQDYKALITALLNIRFQDLKTTELLQIILQSAQKYFEELAGDQGKISARFLIVEHGRPLTLDHEQQEASKQSVMKELNEQLLKHRVHRRVCDLEEASGKEVSEASEKKILEQFKLQSTPNLQELNELAGCIAYYKIAARRYVDYNCLFVRNEFFHTIVQNLMASIEKDLGYGDNVNVDDLDKYLKSKMVPSSRDLKRRIALEAELEILGQTKENIRDVVNTNQPGDQRGSYDSDRMEL